MRPLGMHDLAEMGELASSSLPVAEYESLTLALLARHVGFDAATFRRRGNYGTTVGFDQRLLNTVAPLWPLINAEGERVGAVCRANKGVAVDRDVLDRRAWERQTVNQQLLRPSGLGSTACVLSHWRGRCVAALYLCRSAGGFSATEVAALQLLAPLMHLSEALRWRDASADTSAVVVPEAGFQTPPPASAGLRVAPPGFVQLTPREREVLSYVGLGYTNEQIALACERSSRTVRNQLSSAYAKLGVASRAEAASLLSGLRRS